MRVTADLVVSGGATETVALKGVTSNGLTMNVWVDGHEINGITNAKRLNVYEVTMKERENGY